MARRFVVRQRAHTRVGRHTNTVSQDINIVNRRIRRSRTESIDNILRLNTRKDRGIRGTDMEPSGSTLGVGKTDSTADSTPYAISAIITSRSATLSMIAAGGCFLQVNLDIRARSAP